MSLCLPWRVMHAPQTSPDTSQTQGSCCTELLPIRCSSKLISDWLLPAVSAFLEAIHSTSFLCTVKRDYDGQKETRQARVTLSMKACCASGDLKQCQFSVEAPNSSRWWHTEKTHQDAIPHGKAVNCLKLEEPTVNSIKLSNPPPPPPQTLHSEQAAMLGDRKPKTPGSSRSRYGRFTLYKASKKAVNSIKAMLHLYWEERQGWWEKDTQLNWGRTIYSEPQQSSSCREIFHGLKQELDISFLSMRSRHQWSVIF